MKITKLINKEYKITPKHIITQTFQYLLIVYLILLLIEEYAPKFISNYINLNYLLVLVIIFGVITVLLPQKKIKKQKPKRKDYYFIFILGIIGTILIYIKTKELGWLSYVISIIAGILIILLSILVLEDVKNEEN